MTDTHFVTRLLIDWSNGNRAALDQLTPHVYRELHALARKHVRRRPNQTIQPTALINEVYLRLIDPPPAIQWESRSHFFGIAARIMRIVLVDHVRTNRALKRGGATRIVTLDEMAALSPGHAPDISEIDEALTQLAEVDERKAKVIELRYFGGMSREEIAVALDVTLSTVKRDLRLGEAWLRRYLAGSA